MLLKGGRSLEGESKEARRSTEAAVAQSRATMERPPMACQSATVSHSRVSSSRASAQPASDSLPSSLLQKWIAEGVFSEFTPLLPSTLLTLPRASAGRGHRHRQRKQIKRKIIEEANHLLRSLNSLDCGMSTSRTRRCSAETAPHRKPTAGTPPLSPATRRLHSLVQRLAATAVRERRALSRSESSGAHATSLITKADRTDRYSFSSKPHS